MKSIDDTSNFDDFPEVDLKIRELLISTIIDIPILVIISKIHNKIIIPISLPTPISYLSFLQIFPLIQNRFFNFSFAFSSPVALSNSETLVNPASTFTSNFSLSSKFHFHLNVTFTFPLSAAPSNNDTGQPYKDWVFINYTFKRFEGLTQRGPPVKMAKEVVAPPK